MKILIVNDSFANLGGREKYVKIITNCSNFESLVYGYKASHFIENSIDSPKFQFSNFLKIQKEILKIFYKEKIDIIHSQSRRSYLFIPKSLKNFSILTIHSVPEKWKFLTSFPKETIAVCNFIKEFIIKNYKQQTNINVLYNPIDIYNYDINCLNKKNRKDVAIFSRINLEKININFFKVNVKTIKNNNIMFHFYGPLEEKKVFKYLNYFGLKKHYKYHGFIPNEKILCKMSKYKVLLLLSKSEALPFVIFEAFLSKTPILVYNVGAVSEFLPKDFIFDYNDNKNMMKKLIDLLQNSNESEYNLKKNLPTVNEHCEQLFFLYSKFLKKLGNSKNL